MFKKNPTLEHELAKRVKVDFASKSLSTNKKRAELLEDKLFPHTELVRQKEEYIEVVIRD